MCVLARDEWRKNCDEYPGLCHLFVDIIMDNGRLTTDDEALNAKIETYFTPPLYRATDVSIKDVIQNFVALLEEIVNQRSGGQRAKRQNGWSS